MNCGGFYFLKLAATFYPFLQAGEVMRAEPPPPEPRQTAYQQNTVGDNAAWLSEVNYKVAIKLVLSSRNVCSWNPTIR